MHYVYIVRCADDTLYTGYALDPAARVAVHNGGRGARYTKSRLPVALVYAEAFGSKSEALIREHQVKRLTRAQKDTLIAAFTFRTAPLEAPRQPDTPYNEVSCSTGPSSSSRRAPATER